jgi:hypothetical protein
MGTSRIYGPPLYRCRRFTIVAEYSALFQKSQASVDQSWLDPSGGHVVAGLSWLGN